MIINRNIADIVASRAGETVESFASDSPIVNVANKIDNIVDRGKSAVNDVLSSVIATAKDIVPSAIAALAEPSYKGSQGSFGYIGQDVVLYSSFLGVADEAIELKGRPLLKWCYIKDIPGFVLCDNAKVTTLNMTLDEATAIETFLNKGFYYE